MRLGVLAAIVLVAGGIQGQIQARDLEGRTQVLTEWRLDQRSFEGSRAGKPFSLPRERLWRLERAAAATPARWPREPHFLFRDGLVLEGAPLSSAAPKGKLAARLGPGRDRVVVLLSSVRAILVKPKIEKDAGFATAVAKPPLDGDLCFYLDAKEKTPKVRRFPCRIHGGSGGGLVLEVGGRRRVLPWAKVYALVFGEASGVEPVPPEGFRPDHLQLSDGRVLSGRVLGGDARRGLQIRLLDGFELRIPPASWLGLDLSPPGLRYLSELKPRFETGAALTREWPVLVDERPGGADLALAGRTFRRGFWLVPPAAIELDLPRGATRLLGTAGLLPARFGSAELRILGDGKALAPPYRLVQGRTAFELNLPLAGVSKLRIELSCGPDLDSGSQVVLGDLRLLLGD